MIRLVRPANEPASLNKGSAEVAKHALDIGKGLLPKIRESVYRDTSVRQALHAMQKGKCAYCEAMLAHHYSAIEHFRPKGGWQQRSSDPLTQPGYWWLAYEWSNLFLSCEDSNERFKKNLFPIRGTRATTPSHALSAEGPILVDPCTEDPGSHLSFNEHIVVALTPRGQATIDVLGLNGTPAYQANVDERRKAFEAFIDRSNALDVYRFYWDELTAEQRSDARLIQTRLLATSEDAHACGYASDGDRPA